MKYALAALLAGVFCLNASAQELSLAARQQGRFLHAGEQQLLEISSPWVATGNYQSLYRFPLTAIDPGAHTDSTALGKWTQTITRDGNSLTIRYDFEIAPHPEAAHIQWVWRLEPGDWNGRFAETVAGRPARARGVRPLEGLSVDGLQRMEFLLPDADLVVTCRAADGQWSFRDARNAAWARCYRLEYNREVDISGQRSGWIEVTIERKPAVDATVLLTRGEPLQLQGMAFELGEPRADVNRKLSHLALLHSVERAVPRGETGGEVIVHYAGGTSHTIAFRSEEAFTSPDDDPRSIHLSRLTRLVDNTVAWVTTWQNPRPEEPITHIESRAHAGGWRLLAASAVDASSDVRRAGALLRGDGAVIAEQTVLSLDGTWRFAAEGIEERDIPVPAFWNSQPGLGGVRAATYRRSFDLPSSFHGRRIALRFDAVGDAAEVWVNGRMAGQAISPGLPFEVDITSLVEIPSSGNRLEVRVKDDSHFAVDRAAEPWRAARHWIPRGMGTGNRKGLYQSVTLRARPSVRVADAYIVTSVRNRELVVTYTLQNTTAATIQATLTPSVHPAAGGAAVMKLPATQVELPGYVTTEVSVRSPFEGVELWQPNHPTLYHLRSVLTAGEQRLDRHDTRFGFREVWFEGRNFYLNGIRCNLRGESPAYGEKAELMATREAAAEMIRRYQQVNMNVLRFHAMPAPTHVLDLCDEMGMLVISESAIYASWGMLMPEHPEFMENCRRHLVNWVRRDRNHPSVIMWSADNEGLNVNALTPAQLAAFGRIVSAEDKSRPVIFAGDGTAFGASPASNKHYVRTIADVEHRGGQSSGYARDLRNDIYWAKAYDHDIPLGCGEFLFPYVGALRAREREVAYMMGLQTRGYRFAEWCDIRPYNPSYVGFLTREGVREGYEEAYDIIRKSFAAVAVFDKAYDELGPYPNPPVLRQGERVTRELIVYNDTFAGETVEVQWQALLGGERIAGGRVTQRIPLGEHIVMAIEFTPPTSGELELELLSRKDGEETYRDVRPFEVQ